MQFKKRHIKAIAALAMAAVMAGCSRGSFSGEEALAHGREDLISFSAGTNAVTRSASGTNAVTRSVATASGTNAVTRSVSGADAASKLGRKFVVYGTKHQKEENATAANDSVVFSSYTMEYVPDSTGATITNSNGWEYVDKTSYDSGTELQTLRYWDYGAANGYTFYAFSSPDISYPASSTDAVKVEKITTGTTLYDKGYKVTIQKAADFTKLYFADRKQVASGDFGKPVDFTFRSFGAKVRVGFYETIPGYSVKIKHFHYDKDSKQAISSFSVMDNYDLTSFCAALQNVNTANATSSVVTYHNSTEGVENTPKITNTSVNWNYNLILGSNLNGKTLGTTSATAVYDRDGGAFTDVYPFEQNTNPMLVKVCYTITAEDGQGETLDITEAKAVVPVPYVQWKSNCCYTYLFKITEKTNGTTGTSGDDPDGLYDIVFDAVSISSDEYAQTNLTSVDRFSITTYLYGSDTYIVTTNPETGDIYYPTQIGEGDNQVQMYEVTTTGEDISEEAIYMRLTGTKNGLLLTSVSSDRIALVSDVPATDGTYYTFKDADGKPGALRLTSETNKCYAYVYCNVKHVDAVYTKLESGATLESTTYYTKDAYNVYTVKSITSQDELDAAIATGIYTLHTAPVTGDYAVLRLDTRQMSY